MPIILLTSIISITTAFICYIVVYVMYRRAGTFTWKQWYVLFAGASTDALGTYMMWLLGGGETRVDLHSISGYSGLVAMISMTIYGFYALKKKPETLEKFGKYYFPIMVLWSVAYITGVILGIEKISG